MKEFVISTYEENKTLFKFVKSILNEAPDSFIYKMFRKKNIKINKIKASGNEKLKSGDIINIYLSDETFDTFSTKNTSKMNDEYVKAYNSLKNIQIVYENEDIIIMNKPSNVLSQKAEAKDISLNEWMIGYLLSTNKLDVEKLLTYKPSVLNRLDRNTKGLVIGAKNLRASQVVSDLIKRREIKKIYEAKVKGKINDKLVLEGYLIKDTKENKVSIIKNKPDNKDAYYIKTVVYPIDSARAFSTVEIDLITGKTHQIRAHLSSVGHPILGDPKYGDKMLNKSLGINEQQLVAKRIEFPKDCSMESIKGLVVTL